jgi:P-type Ca2+ transporter type 2C
MTRRGMRDGADTGCRTAVPADHTLAPSWHGMDVATVEARLDTTTHGLSRDEAAARLRRFGPNRLEEAPPPSWLVLVVRQFRSPLIYILVAALGVTVLLGETLDASVIAVVLALNAVIGFAQERKAEQAVHALMGLVVSHARVIRSSEEWDVDSSEIVPGDVVLLEPGARVPADLRLVSANGLRVDESLLTGESAPASKGTEPVEDQRPLADRRCVAYTGSIVTVGRGAGLVVATGPQTELGGIAGLMRREEVPPTPLQQRMDRFARLIGSAVAIGAAVAFMSGVMLGEPAHEMFLIAVALAVSAVPEGLPIAVTITLAIGVRRMARRRAIVRRLAAVETLGSTTVIGSDKTGTLTDNRMTVQTIWTVGHRYRVASDGQDGAFLEEGESAWIDARSALHWCLLTGVLSNEAEAYLREDTIEATGDPTEIALLLSAMSARIEPDEARNAYPLRADVPFEPTRSYSAALREHHDRSYVFAKGAPERIVPMCSQMLTDDGTAPLDRPLILTAAHQLAGEGLRTLAFAYRRIDDPSAAISLDPPRALVFVGLQAMMDPARHGVREAIEGCHRAGIRVVMITGDHAATAASIGHRVGVETAGVLDGTELDQLDDGQLQTAIADTSVFARVSPEQKLRIVNAFQSAGHVVAVTGDGVNDAPALKAAQIGIAMGQGGTDVAREAADMVLADDNFVSIVAAIEEGRVTFDNIRKVTFFLVSTGAAELAAILTGVWLQWPLLLLPAQLLWLNLVTNGLQDIALAFEPGGHHVLQRPPRGAREGILSRLLWERTVLAGVVMAAGTLAMFRWELTTTGSLQRAQTVALSTMVVYQVFQAGNARTETTSLFRVRPWSNPFLLIATMAAVGVHVAALYLPATQYILRVEPIEPAAWVRIVVVASTILVAMEAHKAVARRRQRTS